MFEHQRHQPPTPLARPRELIVAVPPLRSAVNLSRIVRTAGCCGIRRIIVGGRVKVDREIARDALGFVTVDAHRTLLPVIRRFRDEGYRLVGLEQVTGSTCLYDYAFASRTVLVVGHERHGLDEELLRVMEDVVEIPVYGRPASHNAATAAAMAMYEYCRQYPQG